MSSDTPTILKKILARKHEEIAERSALVSIAQLIEKAETADSPQRVCRRTGSQTCSRSVRSDCRN